MTQKYRWLAALALLLAFGVCTVRAEEEEEEAGAAPPFGGRTAQNGRHADRHAVAGLPTAVRAAVPVPLSYADPHGHVRPPARPDLPALPLPRRLRPLLRRPRRRTPRSTS